MTTFILRTTTFILRMTTFILRMTIVILRSEATKDLKKEKVWH